MQERKFRGEKAIVKLGGHRAPLGPRPSLFSVKGPQASWTKLTRIATPEKAMRRQARFVSMGLVCLFILAAAASRVVAATAPIRVAIYSHSSGKARAPHTLQKVLTAADGFDCRLVSPEAIRQGNLNQFDVLIMPGGSAHRQADMLGAQGRDAIRKFVHNGGGYVGICAGSYLATPHYSWSLGLLNAWVVDRQHWARGTGQVWLKLSPEGQRALDDDAEQVRVYYGQGPLLAPGNYAGLPPYEPLAQYATAIARHAPNPAP